MDYRVEVKQVCEAKHGFTDFGTWYKVQRKEMGVSDGKQYVENGQVMKVCDAASCTVRERRARVGLAYIEHKALRA